MALTESVIADEDDYLSFLDDGRFSAAIKAACGLTFSIIGVLIQLLPAAWA